MRYFVDDRRRLVRTHTETEPVVPESWREVTSDEYDAFRLETRTEFKPDQLKKLRTPQ